MPKLKRNVKNAKSSFAIYDGPTPTKRGVYHAKVVSCVLKKSNAGNDYFSMRFEFVDEREDKVQFKGYTDWAMIVLTDHEANLAREASFYRAILGRDKVDDVETVFEPEENGARKVLKIGGKNPVGVVVGVSMKPETYEGETRLKADMLLPIGESVAKAKAKALDEDDDEEDEDDDEEDEDDEDGVEIDEDDEDEDDVEDEDDDEEDEEDEDDEDEEEDEVDRETRKAELMEMKIVPLRQMARNKDIETAGVKKPQLVEMILDKIFAEEVSEEESEEAELREELASFDRNTLKKRLKASNPSFKVLKRHTDDDLKDAIVEAELGEDGETPF